MVMNGRRRTSRAPGYTARQGVCDTVTVQPQCVCSGDGDCPAGEVCDGCNCVPDSGGGCECTTNADCGAGMVCDGCNCVPDGGNGNGGGEGMDAGALLLLGGIGALVWYSSRN